MPTLDELAAALPAAIATEKQARQLAEAEAVAKGNEVTRLSLLAATLTAENADLRKQLAGQGVVRVTSIAEAAAKLANGVTLEFADGTYDFVGSKGLVNTFNNVSIVAAPNARPVIRYTGAGSAIAIEHRGNGLTVRGIDFDSAMSIACEGVVSINGRNAVVDDCGATERIRNFTRANGCDGFQILKPRAKKLRKHLFVADPRRSDADPWNANVLIDTPDFELSTEERGVRLQGVKNVLIKGGRLLNGANDFKDALNIRDGDGVVVRDVELGEITIEVMGDGDGGINMPPGAARDFELGKRLTNVLVTGGSIRASGTAAYDTINVGRGIRYVVVENVDVDLGLKDDYVVRYDLDEQYSPFRPDAQDVEFRNVRVTARRDRPVRFVSHETPGVKYRGLGCTVNGVAV